MYLHSHLHGITASSYRPTPTLSPQFQPTDRFPVSVPAWQCLSVCISHVSSSNPTIVLLYHHSKPPGLPSRDKAPNTPFVRPPMVRADEGWTSKWSVGPPYRSLDLWLVVILQVEDLHGHYHIVGQYVPKAPNVGATITAFPLVFKVTPKNLAICWPNAGSMPLLAPRMW